MSGGATAEGAVRLSICIPTYNFGAFIGETLESVLSQVVDGVEVVVLDGGSTDDTTQVVESFQQRHPSLRYERRDERGGIDRDMARTVDLGRGEYCWIFCSDDLMKPGAIARVLEHIEGGHDLYLPGFTICTPDMKPVLDLPILNSDADASFDLGNAAERRRYFALAQTTPAFFSFAGSLIVRKERWDSVPLDENFVGSCWAHAARLLALIPGGLRVKYIAQPYLDKRTENDSFMDQGLVRRYGLAIDGYHRLARTFFPEDSPEAFDMRRVVTNEFPPHVLLNAKVQARDEGRLEDLTLVDRLAAEAYSDRTLRNRVYGLAYRATPLSVFTFTRAVFRVLRSILHRCAIVLRRQ